MAKTIWNDNPNYTYSHKTFKNGQWTYYTTNSSIRRYKKNQKKKRREAKRAEKELRQRNNPNSLFPRQPSETEYKIANVLAIIGFVCFAPFLLMIFIHFSPILIILYVLWRVRKRKSNNK